MCVYISSHFFFKINAFFIPFSHKCCDMSLLLYPEAPRISLFWTCEQVISCHKGPWCAQFFSTGHLEFASKCVSGRVYPGSRSSACTGASCTVQPHFPSSCSTAGHIPFEFELDGLRSLPSHRLLHPSSPIGHSNGRRSPPPSARDEEGLEPMGSLAHV